MIVQLFARLVREESDFERHPPTFSPWLARSWDWSPDHKVLTFHLRENARWSDGVPVDADDVRWTWQEQVSPDIGWQSAFMKKDIADVEVADPHTIRFRFKRVYAKQLTDVNEGGILPISEFTSSCRSGASERPRVTFAERHASTSRTLLRAFTLVCSVLPKSAME